MGLRKDALRVPREKQKPRVTELLGAAILSDDSPGLIEKIGVGPMVGSGFEKALGKCLDDTLIQICPNEGTARGALEIDNAFLTADLFAVDIVEEKILSTGPCPEPRGFAPTSWQIALST
jgi:hypothetical protein